MATELFLKARYISSDTFLAAAGRKLMIGNASNGTMKLVLELPANNFWQDVAYLGDDKAYAISLADPGEPSRRSHVFYSDDGGTTWLDQTSQIFGPNT